MMNISKSFLFSCIIIGFFSFTSIAQQQKNRIIVWDVTASMVGSTNNIPPSFGHNPALDIDTQVRSGIKKMISEAPEDNGEIRIMPFGTNIVENKVFKNTSSGKQAAINYIDSYRIQPQLQGYTNICRAWDNAMLYLASSNETIVYIFTDGVQNISHGPMGINCLSQSIQKYCDLTKDTKNFTFLISLNLPATSFSSSLNNICSNNFAYIPVHDVKNGLSTPVLLQAMWNEIIINVQDNGLSGLERFRIMDGIVPEDIQIKAELIIDPSYHLDIKATKVKLEDGKIDVKFELEDIDGTINTMKSIEDLSIEGTIKLTSQYHHVHFDPIALDFKIINKKPQKLHFTIQ